jgi:hypothetical protein
MEAWHQEGVGFEPTRPFGLTAFKAVAINHSAIPPPIHRYDDEVAIAAFVFEEVLAYARVSPDGFRASVHARG